MAIRMSRISDCLSTPLTLSRSGMATAISSLLALLPDDEQRHQLGTLDPGAGLISHICSSPSEADRLLRRIQPDVLVAGRGVGLTWIRQAHARDPDAFRIICVERSQLVTAINHVNHGDADAVLREPFDIQATLDLFHHGCEQALLRRHTRSLVDELAVRNAELLGFNERLEELVAERTRHLVEARERLEESQRQMVQLETQSTVTHLLRGLAHEFNNPLAAIYGYAQRMRRQFASDPDAARRLDVILQEVGHCRTVVTQLGQLATPLSEQPASVDPRTLLVEAGKRLEAAGLALPHLQIDPGTPDAVAAPRALVKAFEQIIANACESGAKTISLRGDSSGGRTRLQIENDGDTPDELSIANAIRPFYTTRASQGHRGLGLSTAAALLREQDGTIQLDRRANGGAVILITLPSTRSAGRGSSSGLLPAISNAMAAAPTTTLVVDDEPMVAEILVDALRETGCHTAVAGSFAEGIAELTRLDVRALVVDLNLPDGSGLDLARRALALKPHLAGHIALTTGESDSKLIERLIVDHGFPVLAKPFRLEQVSALAAQIR
jgi:signal transduction histidine kinase